MSIYEVHPGSWKRNANDGGRWLTYRELADDLIPYVKGLGFTHIELMGIAEHPFDGSWGYQVTGYYAPTSRFGNPDEFREFVDRCHQRASASSSTGCPAISRRTSTVWRKFDGTALYEHEDPRLGEHMDWGTLIFNYGRNEVKNFLVSNALFWLEQYPHRRPACGCRGVDALPRLFAQSGRVGAESPRRAGKPRRDRLHEAISTRCATRSIPARRSSPRKARPGRGCRVR
jgi:hypothetical protein